MSKITLLLSLLLLSEFAQSITSPVSHQEGFSVYTRSAQSLNGEYKAIVDPYENGYYNYRYKPFDEQKTRLQVLFLWMRNHKIKHN